MHSIAGAYMAGWVGPVIGPNGLTAVVVVNVLVWFMLVSAIMGIASASSILIAQAYASGRHRQLKAITGNSVCFVVVGSVVMSLFGWFGSPILIDWISTPEEARALAITFLRATALSILTVFPLVFMTIMIRGVGDSKTPFRFTMFWIGLSMLAQPVFLTGALGVPALGMEGVAHANTAAAGIALVALLIYLRWSRHPLMLLGPDLRFLLPDLKTLKLLMMRGLPMGVEGVLISGVYLVLLSMVNRYGAATSAGYGAATQLWGFIQMPIGALSASVAAMASQNIGAGQWSRVRELALKASLLGVSSRRGGRPAHGLKNQPARALELDPPGHHHGSVRDCQSERRDDAANPDHGRNPLGCPIAFRRGLSAAVGGRRDLAKLPCRNHHVRRARLCILSLRALEDEKLAGRTGLGHHSDGGIGLESIEIGRQRLTISAKVANLDPVSLLNIRGQTERFGDHVTGITGGSK
jgi:hypothetical protein